MFGNFDIAARLADYGIEPSEASDGGGPPVEEADDDEARDPPHATRDQPRVTRGPPRVTRDAIESTLGSTRAPILSAQVVAKTLDWVEAVIVKMRVCPFSSSAHRAGIPAGGISYPITRATVSEARAATWTRVSRSLARSIHEADDRG